MTTNFATLPLECITPSLTNPRKSFNAVKLTELAESIKASGVHQPILVRPLPGARMLDTDRAVTHELVAGERRYRASQQAGLDTIPALVRDLTDAQVMEIQLIENLQRDDLTELEEAEGYQALMDASGLNADAIASKIAKSRSYVFARLKLLDLCTEARESLRTGALDASRALLVARIPDSKLQIQAIKDILQGHSSYYSGGREAMSHREAKAFIQDRYMVKLDSAKFDITCIELLPAAGSCKTCSKRTGHDPDLFSDVKGADVCTDPPCFHKKEEAHTAKLMSAAQAKGQTVISGKEATELRGNGYQDKFKGYRRLDSADDSPTDQPLRKLIGKQMQAEGIKPVAIEHPTRKGELVECLPNETVLKLLKTIERQAATTKTVTKDVQKMVDEKKAKATAKAMDQYEKEWRKTLLHDAWCEMRDDADIKAFTADVHRYLAVRAAGSLSTDNAAAICQLLDLGKISPVSAVVDYAKETINPELLNVLIIMQEASGAYEHTYGGRIANEGLLLVAGNVYGDKLDDVITEIKAETKARIWPKVAKSPLPLDPAAQAKGGGGAKAKKAQSPAALANPVPVRKRKMTADEAQAAIATAMQGQDTNPGADAQGDDGAGEQPVATSAADAPGVAQAVDEPLYKTAVNIIVVQQFARAARLGTMLGVSNSMAFGMLERMESEGIVGPLQKDGGRKVLQPSPIPVTDDPLYQGALDIIVREQKANVRLLKTGLKVSTTRALDLMDKLEQAGQVSACDERGARKVLVAA